MKAFIFPSLSGALVVAAALVVRAQDHIEYEPPTPAMAKFKANTDTDAATPAPGQFKGKGGGRGKGGGAPDAAAKKGGGGRGLSAADLDMDLEKIIANPSDLARGQRIFEQQCVTCHGPKGEGDRGPSLRRPSLPRAPDDRTLMQVVSRGIPNTEMPGGRMKAGEAPYLAAYVRSLGRIAQEKVPGDADKGRELVKSKGACLTCHTIAGEGTAAIGPDLSDIGLRRSPNFLRRALVDPSADVPLTAGPGNFAFIKVKTKDGKEASGVRMAEGTFYVQFRDITGSIWSLPKSELVSFTSDRTSPMPVYQGLFTPGEMDDVIAYLVSLQGKKM